MRCCGHDEHDHRAIIRNLVWDKLTPMERVDIHTLAPLLAEARTELEELP